MNNTCQPQGMASEGMRMEKVINNLDGLQALQGISIEALAHKNFLTDEYNDNVRDVVEYSQNIKNSYQLFNWLQASFQYLVRHEVFIYATRSGKHSHYHFDYLSCSRYFTEDTLKSLTVKPDSLLQLVMQQWQTSKKPLFVVDDEESEEMSEDEYVVTRLDEKEFTSTELREFVVHGLSEQGLMVIFGRLQHHSRKEIAANLRLLMPTLQRVISSVIINADKQIKAGLYGPRPYSAKKLSRREVEVLAWLQLGKTNWEISNILNVSPLTVKNHVQNIIKKLGVKNRRQAAAKGVRLGLVKK